MTYQSIKVRKLTPRIGAEISGVDLGSNISNHQFDEIRTAFLDNQVIFFRDQKMSVEQQKAFGRRFGKLHKVPNPRFPVNGDPEVLGIKADETSTHVSGDIWHSDTTSATTPPLGSMLYMHEVPENGGGDTMFASMYAAFEALSDSMKKFLSGLTAIHDGAQVYLGKGRPPPTGDIPRTEHPVVRPHPDTGRNVLFVNRLFTSHIVQLAPKESDALLEMLYQHAASPEFQCRFKWDVGSVAFWDNRCAHHYAVWDYFPHRRYGHRITISDG
ncbi:MAG: TauD/TfdA dioxygenase family protein [Rhodospirillales bacterium]|jgi:taurine dioxygenase